MRQAVFRTAASATIGGGHVSRCLALADALADTGWSCRFAVERQTVVAMPALEASRHEAIYLAGGGGDDAEEIRSNLADKIDLLVVDHYRRDAAFESACRSWTGRILVIDDLANRRHDADFLLDQTLGRNAADYEPLVPSSCQMLLGPAFALLRSQFSRLRSSALARRDGKLRRVLVCMGNSDPRDMTRVALRAIAKADIGVAVDVVLGSNSPNRADLEAEIANMDQEIRLHLDVADMARLVMAADLAIGSSGVIAWERCVLGLPAIAVVTADNQRMIAVNLDAAGAVCFAGDWLDRDEDRIAALLCEFAERPDLLAAMSRKAAAICDGEGVARTTSAICGVQ